MMEKLLPASIGQTRVGGGFWAPILQTVREQMLPYQWDALNDRIDGAAPSHAIKNFEIAAGCRQGEMTVWLRETME